MFLINITGKKFVIKKKAPLSVRLYYLYLRGKNLQSTCISLPKKIYEINEKSIIYNYRLTFYSYIRLHLL